MNENNIGRDTRDGRGRNLSLVSQTVYVGLFT
jgi:hypothetical protein